MIDVQYLPRFSKLSYFPVVIWLGEVELVREKATLKNQLIVSNCVTFIKFIQTKCNTYSDCGNVCGFKKKTVPFSSHLSNLAASQGYSALQKMRYLRYISLYVNWDDPIFPWWQKRRTTYQIMNNYDILHIYIYSYMYMYISTNDTCTCVFTYIYFYICYIYVY